MKNMNNHISNQTVRTRLEERNLRYRTLALPGGCEILVMEMGGRVFGPYRQAGDEGIFWVNKAFADRKSFASFLEDPKEWCFGGDRYWVTPEFPFFCRRRKDFFASYVVQKGIDPAEYTLKTDPYGNLFLQSELRGELYENEIGSKEALLEKTVRANENPLRYLDKYGEYMQEVTFTGFEQEAVIYDTSKEKELELELWNLTQVNPGGQILIPYTRDFGYVDYYAPVDENIISDRGSHIAVNVRSSVDHKLGFYSATTLGRAAYLTELEGGTWCLFVKNYYNDPSAYSVGEPWNQPGKRGCSLYLYIDGGAQGGFAEFENVGRAIGGSTGRKMSVDNTNYWFYYGAKASLMEIASVLLGTEIGFNS